MDVDQTTASVLGTDGTLKDMGTYVMLLLPSYCICDKWSL